jgi:hypothetical protein
MGPLGPQERGLRAHRRTLMVLGHGRGAEHALAARQIMSRRG